MSSSGPSSVEYIDQALQHLDLEAVVSSDESGNKQGQSELQQTSHLKSELVSLVKYL